jgi:hypothetical protein
MKLVFSILFLVGILSTGFTQQRKNPEDIKLYYRSSVAYGFYLHTAGFGGSFKYQRHASYKDKRFYMLEFQKLKHPKEEKVKNAFDDNAKSFYYGKINALTNLRIGLGSQHAFAMKEIKKGVQIAYLYSGGFNLGFQKPIYLDIYTPSGRTETERYDPEIHSYSVIAGRASFVNGISEIKLVPGIFGKFGLNFEYSPYDNKLKALEVGVAVDLFFKEVPLMYNSYNNQYWVSFYLMFEFGKKIE